MAFSVAAMSAWSASYQAGQQDDGQEENDSEDGEVEETPLCRPHVSHLDGLQEGRQVGIGVEPRVELVGAACVHPLHPDRVI